MASDDLFHSHMTATLKLQFFYFMDEAREQCAVLMKFYRMQLGSFFLLSLLTTPFTASGGLATFAKRYSLWSQQNNSDNAKGNQSEEAAAFHLS